MKTIAKTETKSKLFAVLLAVFLVIASLCATPRTSVAADIELPDPPHVCTEFCYTDILYFSDVPVGDNYRSWLLGNVVPAYTECHSVFNKFYYIDLNDNDLPIDFIAEVGDLSQIENSLIIYEQRNRFYKQIVYSEDEPHFQTSLLKELFSTWKDANCKIMYICGTDEEFFCDYDRNEFLDYVDIHVNVDLFSYFVDSFFQIYREHDCSHTIILDRSLSIDCMSGMRPAQSVGGVNCFDTSSFCGYILPMYLRMMYDIEYIDAQYIYEILYLLDLNVLCYLGGNTFYDMSGGTYYYTDHEDFFDTYDSDRYCYVSTTLWYDDYHDLEWLFPEIEYDSGREIDTYLFIDYGCYDRSEDSELFQFDFTFGLDRFQMANYLKPIMYDFIMGNDLYQYDNWYGRCEITAKPIGFGEGWVRMLNGTAKEVSDVDILDDDVLQYLGSL